MDKITPQDIFYDKYKGVLKLKQDKRALKPFELCRNKEAAYYSHPGDPRTLEEKMFQVQYGETIEDYLISICKDVYSNPNKFENNNLYSYSYDLVDYKNNLRIEVKGYSDPTISFTMRNNKKWSPPPGKYHCSCLDLTHPINGFADIILFCKVKVSGKKDKFLEIKPSLIIDSNLDSLAKIGNKSLKAGSIWKDGKEYVSANWIGLSTRQMEEYDIPGEGIRRI